MEMSGQSAGAEGGGGWDKLRLKVASGNAAGTVIEVADELVIGRQVEGAGSLGNDIEISRRHARIACGPEGRFVIEDLGSTNGTYVNGRLVEGTVTLEAGDRIEMGASVLIVQVSAPAPTPPSTPVTTTSAATGPETAAASAAEGAPADEGVELSAAPARLPRLSLKIDVDLEAGVITVGLEGEEADQVRLVYEDGRWRLA